ncbi:MAG: NAD(P)H-binding protein [Putridiphycobacter sp.]|nr:NAD(P)H-binding protein [Putridiphycobacter sp.]
MIAIVIGATGLIGKQLVKQLLADDLYTEVKVFLRRSTGISNPKLKEFIINFEALDQSVHLIKGDVLFSVLGTTLRTAGSKNKQYNIDYHYQYNFAKIAANNGVSNYVLLSSIGANAKSSVFYSKMKGELDEAVQELPFEHISILRPSMLDGNREEFRLAEKLFTPIMRAVVLVPCWKKYRPIKDVTVAKAMRNAVHENETAYHIYESNYIFLLADSR